MSDRLNYVAAPEFFKLNQACELINKAFGSFGCYHVGSSIKRRDYRDVDVRLILSDEEYDAMFRCNGTGEWVDARWSLMCVSISVWLREVTGLPIDFQIQRFTQANKDYPRMEDQPRHPLGIFTDMYLADVPSRLHDT